MSTVALSVARQKEHPVEDDLHFEDDAAVVSRDPFSPLMMCYALVWLNDKSCYVNRKPRMVINKTKKAILSCPLCSQGVIEFGPEDNKGFLRINVEVIRLCGVIFCHWFTLYC